jgi:glyoxylase-like metal-dependent hydrolase (beta-lactamase superfamily II)
MLITRAFDDVIRFDLARTLLGRGRYWTAAYWVDGMLIDSGCDYTAAEMRNALSGKAMRTIINTHAHEDHIGCNALLQRERSDLKILAHPLAIPILADPCQLRPLHPYRALFWGLPEPSQGYPVEECSIIATDRYNFQVIYTPGHSPDHICLYEPERNWMFTGDLYVGGQERALRADYDIWQMIASFKKVAALPLTRLFPGSARVRENPSQEIRDKIDYLEEMGSRAMALYEKGWSIPAITRALCGGPMPVEFITLGHFSRKHLIRSYLDKHTPG